MTYLRSRFRRKMMMTTLYVTRKQHLWKLRCKIGPDPSHLKTHWILRETGFEQPLRIWSEKLGTRCKNNIAYSQHIYSVKSGLLWDNEDSCNVDYYMHGYWLKSRLFGTITCWAGSKAILSTKMFIKDPRKNATTAKHCARQLRTFAVLTLFELQKWNVA